MSLKFAGALGGAAAASTGAYGIYHLSSSKPTETIRSKLEAHFKGTNTIFLESGHEEWSKLSDWYSKAQNKPKKDDGASSLDLSEVKIWCSEKVSREFKSDTDSLYQQVKNFCFLNVNTLLKESGKSSLRSSQSAEHQDWKNAWTSYNSDSSKESKGLKISDLSVNVNEEVAGGKAMHAWCTATKDKKMYDSESLFSAFKAWCLK
ncbi:hypothetical protein HF1_06400 [Mycoplasma haemofelis str. Langford 1]|uniref:Uncharacterized protein n=2 Tax=Mycoplasma haemofelis TaxID=29501 RepID=F6FIB4_MYCHI|nr:hypothetical protein [Mycoplasma haemofelis]AEG72962.1 hypothetical protein MHF_0692 [Mycoplasma haemofelis Ohio2]CBY92648.1 hypothetical protein HF1_06400 [Mycoplasma haemofelis str. Langford 1]